MGTSWSHCGFWSMVMQSYKSSCCLLEKGELVVMCQSRHASHRVSKLLVLFGKKWLERGLDVRPQCFARGLGVKKEDEGLCRDGCRQCRQDGPLRVLDGKGFSDFDKRADGAEH